MNIFSILQSPDDGTPIGPDLLSEGGIKYEMTKSGVLLLDSCNSRSSDIAYKSVMFKKWDSIVNERIKYYTGKQSVAGLLANWSYRSIRRFNERGRMDFRYRMWGWCTPHTLEGPINLYWP